jgi:chromosome segregation ATPase
MRRISSEGDSPMSTIDESLVNAIRGVVGEAIAPLGAKIDGLAERVDRVEAEQRAQRALLEGMSTRLTAIELRLSNIEDRVTALEEYAEKLDTRTSQFARDLFEMQDRLDQATRALKRETTFSLKEASRVQTAQLSDQKKIRDLEAKIAELQRRIEAIESGQAGSAP